MVFLFCLHFTRRGLAAIPQDLPVALRGKFALIMPA